MKDGLQIMLALALLHIPAGSCYSGDVEQLDIGEFSSL